MLEYAERRFPRGDARSVFGKAVTNHVCGDSPLSECIVDYHLSMINHSELPNAVYLTRGGAAGVTIVVDVSAGEEIVCNYDAGGGEAYTRDW